ncbi:DNA polymerase delta [Theobroma cacao]|nr:DNA polymerase delta [Theobroma cacao]
MATTSKNMKGFYRQKKNNSRGGITKSKSSKSTKNPSPSHAATFGSDITQPAALTSPGDDFDVQEEVSRHFDMNMAYGPCLGITRMARWERAQRLGLNPPKEIENLLKGGKVKLESLFGGRV